MTSQTYGTKAEKEEYIDWQWLSSTDMRNTQRSGKQAKSGTSAPVDLPAQPQLLKGAKRLGL